MCAGDLPCTAAEKESKSCSISDGSIGFLDEAERLKDRMDASQGTCARRQPAGRRQTARSKPILAMAAFYGNRVGFHKIYLHQWKIVRVNCTRRAGKFSCSAKLQKTGHFRRDFIGGHGNHATPAKCEKRQT